MLKVALTHDVDRIRKHYQYFTYFTKALLNSDLKTASYHIASLFMSEPYWNFPEIMRLEDSYGLKSTFFILDETIPFKLFDKKNWQLSLGRYKISNKKLRDAIQILDKNGWEIGVHGSYLSFNDENLLKKEKQNIEEIIGHNIIGTRQHYLNWNENTWKIQKNCGFKYDSTWGLIGDIGFKENKISPFKPNDDYFTEIPLIVMDTEFMPLSGKWEKLEALLNTIQDHDGVFVINWHHRVFNEREFPGYKSAYERIIQMCKDRNAHFKTMSEFYAEFENKFEK